MAKLVMHHKAFVAPPVSGNFRSHNEMREQLRAQAQAFINQIGAEKVISVVELDTSFAPYEVVVWYRAEASELGASEENRPGNDASSTLGGKPG
jgi:hypothetical protein